MSKNPYLVFPDAKHLSAEDLAVMLVERGQVEASWNSTALPKSPYVEVRSEVMREFATFVIPLSIIAVYYLIAGVSSLMITLPAALIVGVALDRILTDDVKKAIAKEVDTNDRGRFEGQLWIAHKLGVPAQDVTLATVQQLYGNVIARRNAEASASQREAENYAHFMQNVDGYYALIAKAKATGTRFPEEAKAFYRRHKDRIKHYEKAPMPQRGRIFAAGSAAAMADEDGVLPQMVINPATGSPMVSGTQFGIDVTGHVYGSNQ